MHQSASMKARNNIWNKVQEVTFTTTFHNPCCIQQEVDNTEDMTQTILIETMSVKVLWVVRLIIIIIRWWLHAVSEMSARPVEIGLVLRSAMYTRELGIANT